MRWIIILVISAVVVIALIGGGSYWYYNSSKNGTATNTGAAPKPASSQKGRQQGKPSKAAPHTHVPLGDAQREAIRLANRGSGVMHLQAFSSKTDPLASCHFVYDPIPFKQPSSDLPRVDARDRFVGCMVGLAIGDAYGSAYEFMTPAQVAGLNPGDDHKHPGYFSKRLGAWTDDTSMALCLLASAIEKGQFDPEDVFAKYLSWYNKRYMNFDKNKTDFGATTKVVLSSKYIDVAKQPSWGNGVIMRLAPVAMQYAFADTESALRIAAASGAMTAGDQGALDFTAFLAYILRGFIKGDLSKKDVCAADFPEKHLGWYWDKYPYGANFKKFVQSYPQPMNASIPAEEFASHIVLSRAIHSFCTNESFTAGLQKVVGFGADTDTAAAIFGQIYGAFYGMQNRAGRDGNAVKGLQHEKLFSSTERCRAIHDLSSFLFIQTSKQEIYFSIPDLVNWGTVADINPGNVIPNYEVKPGVQVIR